MSRELFDPTDEQRGIVKAFAAYGVQQDEIAKYIEIDPKTLRKHFRRELDVGSIEATSKVAQSLYKAAMSGNVGAAIFWMKARGGWREKHDIEITGKDGGPINIASVNFKNLSDEELAQMQALMTKSAGEKE